MKSGVGRRCAAMRRCAARTSPRPGSTRRSSERRADPVAERAEPVDRLVAEHEPQVQKMRPAAGGGMELTMRVGIAPDLENWILSWGDHAEVIEPPELRKRICTTVRNMATK